MSLRRVAILVVLAIAVGLAGYLYFSDRDDAAGGGPPIANVNVSGTLSARAQLGQKTYEANYGFLEAGARHLERRTPLEEARELGTSAPDAVPSWREGSRDLRETARHLLGDSQGDMAETRAAARLEDMPRLVEELAPSLLELEGVGTENAGAVMVAVGDNPDRLRSEASFAMMCGVCPIPASSGKTQRHRLNRGGNRQANSALHMVVVCRMRTDERTRAYVARRTLEGLSKREIMRCLKRYVAREIYRVLTAPSSA